MRFLWFVPLMAGCKPVACTLIGCASALTLHVDGAGEAVGLVGTVDVGGQTYAIDCDGESDPEVACDGPTVTIALPEDVEGEVTWTLSVPSEDTGTGGGSYVGNGTFTPVWELTTPNGPGCEPTCASAEATVALQGTP